MSQQRPRFDRDRRCRSAVTRSERHWLHLTLVSAIGIVGAAIVTSAWAAPAGSPPSPAAALIGVVLPLFVVGVIGAVVGTIAAKQGAGTIVTVVVGGATSVLAGFFVISTLQPDVALGNDYTFLAPFAAGALASLLVSILIAVARRSN